MCHALIKILKQVPRLDSNALKVIEPLLVAGFSSPHKPIVNEMIVFWTETFGEAESLVYPATLAGVMRARRLDAEIELPTFPESSAEAEIASLPDFFESQASPPVEAHFGQNEEETGDGARDTDVVDYGDPQEALGPPSLSGRPSVSSAVKEVAHKTSLIPKPRPRHDDSQVEFAPIDSSPIQPMQESQLLTERQKEVRRRQVDNAQLFLGLSSSPQACSTPLPKRLNFSWARKETNDGGPSSTPLAPTEANDTTVVEFQSSPTPSSTKKVRHSSHGMLHEQVQAKALEEDLLPSSPPRSSDGDRVLVEQPTSHEQPSSPGAFATAPASRSSGPRSEREPRRSETKSNTDMPGDGAGSAETRVEEVVMADSAEKDSLEKDSRRDAMHDADHIECATSQLDSQEVQHAPVCAEPPEQIDQTECDMDNRNVCKVMNSFLEPTADGLAEETVGSQQSSRKRKRKRKPSGVSRATTRPRPSKSSLNRLLSSFWGPSQQGDDGVEDEIALATPADRREAAVKAKEDAPSTPAKSERGTARSECNVVETTRSTSAQSERSKKRRRGRSGRSDVMDPDPDDTKPSPLKRKASQMSLEKRQTSEVEDTPAPAKASRTRNLRSASGRSASGAHALQSPTRATNSPDHRVATAVVVQAAEHHQSTGRAAEEGEATGTQQTSIGNEVDAAQVEAQHGEQHPAEGRLMATPKSILGRLRAALGDLTGMRMSTSEARECDDALFELKREVFEAERRGRPCPMSG